MLIRREDFGDVEKLTYGSSKKIWFTCEICGIGVLQIYKTYVKQNSGKFSKGEYFREFLYKDLRQFDEDIKNNKLLAFLRLRFPSQQKNRVFPKLNATAIIRELHTYGHLVPIDQRSKQAVQHLGLGKKLMQQAEKIASKNGYQKMAVISGIGVRKYYHKLGYKLEGTYMAKNLK